MTQTQDALARLAAAVAMMGVAAVVRGQTTTYFVDARAPQGGDGLSWETAYPDLQDVLETTLQGEVRIYMAGGRYRPDRGTLDQSRTFANSSSAVVLDIRGSCAGLGAADPFAISIEQHPTILTGDLQGDDLPSWSNRVDNTDVLMDLRGDDQTVHHLSDLVFEGSGYRYWNGIEYWNSGAALRSEGQVVCNRCQFRDNIGDWIIGIGFSPPMVTARLVDCTVTGNLCQDGALYATGATLKRCRISGNTGRYAAEFVLVRSAPCVLEECVIEDNICEVTTPWFSPVRSIEAGITNISNCLIRTDNGYVVSAPYSVTRIVNSTLVGGGTPDFAAVQVAGRVSNSILWQAPGAIAAPPFGLSVEDSLVQGGFPGNRNRGDDPRFIDPDAGDFRLRPGSPAIDAGANASLLEISTSTLDLDGNPRFRDDPGTPDTGLGLAPIVAIDAYEFQGTTCYADCDASGGLNVLDFNCFLNSFAAGSPRANCDNSSTPPILNLVDFTCFINASPPAAPDPSPEPHLSPPSLRLCVTAFLRHFSTPRSRLCAKTRSCADSPFHPPARRSNFGP